MQEEVLLEEKKINNTQKMASPNPKVKGGYFVTGSSDPKDLFISEEFDEEAVMIRESLKEFCIKEIQEPFFKRGRELEVTNLEDREEVVGILKRAGELGFCGVSIPEAYGGMGLDVKLNTLISTTLAYGNSFATTLGAQTSIGCLPIVYYGNEAQKQQYLPKIATGELIAAYALTEPNAGSDANSGKTKATLSDDEQNYIINGQKIWITNGGIADIYIVFAKIDEDKNLSAFIVERDFEGFTIGAEEKKFGIKGSSTTQIFFDNCKVPVENLLGDRQGGFKMALTILNGGRIKAGAGGIGGSINAIEKAAEYAVERKQFGKAIAEFGAIKNKVAHIVARIFACEAASFRTADLIDKKEKELLINGATEGEAKIQSTTEFAIEASLVKVTGSDLVCHAIDEAMQIYGGMGYSAETGLGMGYRDARITKIYEGTNEINALLAVGELFKRALQTKEIDLVGAGKGIPGFILSQLNPFRSKGLDNEQNRVVQALKYTFLYIAGIAGKQFKKELIDEQEIIMNLSTILQEAYLAESALLKILKLRSMENYAKDHLKAQEHRMQLFLYLALNKAKSAAHEAIDSFAEGFQKKLHKRIINILLQPFEINPKEIGRQVANTAFQVGGYHL